LFRRTAQSGEQGVVAETLTTICLLMRGAARSAVAMEGPAGSGDEFLSTAGAYYVNAEGTLVLDSPEEPAFCVRLWLPTAEYRGPLTLIEAATGRRHIYELTSEAIPHLSVTE